MECPVPLARMIRLICGHMQFLKTKALAREPVIPITRQARHNLPQLVRIETIKSFPTRIANHFESASDKTVTGTDRHRGADHHLISSNNARCHT